MSAICPRTTANTWLAQGEIPIAEVFWCTTANHALYPIAMMARILGLSRSGFDAWRDRKPSRWAQADAVLTEKTGAFQERSKRTYGAPRIHADFLDDGIRGGPKTCQTINGIYRLERC